jgi:hypothetical protein
MWPFEGKPKRIIVKRYRATLEGSASRKMEANANRMAAKGYRLVSVADKRRKLAVNHRDVFATYELAERG